MSAPTGRWTEPGRHVDERGQIVYAWPPEGRFAALWWRIHAVIPDEEKGEALALLLKWRDQTATLLAYTDDSGDWQDVEVDWDALAERGWP